MSNLRGSGRNFNDLRNIKFTRNYTKYSDGSVLIECGDTVVLCSATISDTVPSFLDGKESGWITAEYSMLPSATHRRNKRDSVQGKVNSRAQEIQRLIGRSLRSAVDLVKLGSRQIIIDCDVLQADGGTRVASINGGFIALFDALTKLVNSGKLSQIPLNYFVAAISVGILNENILLDLDYLEDSGCDADVNIVMNEKSQIIEIQGTAERMTFNKKQMIELIDLAEYGINQVINLQKQVVGCD